MRQAVFTAVLLLVFLLNILNISTLYVGVTVKEVNDRLVISQLDPNGAAAVGGLHLGDTISALDGRNPAEVIKANGRIEQVSTITAEKDDQRSVYLLSHSYLLANQYLSYVFLPALFFMLSLIAVIMIQVKNVPKDKYFAFIMLLGMLALCFVSAPLNAKHFIVAQYFFPFSLIMLPYLYYNLAVHVAGGKQKNWIHRNSQHAFLWGSVLAAVFIGTLKLLGYSTASELGYLTAFMAAFIALLCILLKGILFL